MAKKLGGRGGGLGINEIEKIKIIRVFWNYQLDSTTNPAHLPQKLTKLAESAVLFS